MTQVCHLSKHMQPNHGVYKQNGSKLHLGGKNEIIAEAGDRIRIETPGGGGYGKEGT
jgi:5-oxoprolinase (ATP-hydrolysing)